MKEVTPEVADPQPSDLTKPEDATTDSIDEESIFVDYNLYAEAKDNEIAAATEPLFELFPNSYTKELEEFLDSLLNHPIDNSSGEEQKLTLTAPPRSLSVYSIPPRLVDEGEKHYKHRVRRTVEAQKKDIKDVLERLEKGDFREVISDTGFINAKITEDDIERRMLQLQPDDLDVLSPFKLYSITKFTRKLYLRERADTSAYAFQLGEVPPLGSYVDVGADRSNTSHTLRMRAKMVSNALNISKSPTM